MYLSHLTIVAVFVVRMLAIRFNWRTTALHGEPRAAFVALECEGLARVDLFLDRKSGQFYLNEINTLPGFTQISMYPKLWEATGVPYRELLSRLIDLAVARHERKRKLVREFTS